MVVYFYIPNTGIGKKEFESIHFLLLLLQFTIKI